VSTGSTNHKNSEEQSNQKKPKTLGQRAIKKPRAYRTDTFGTTTLKLDRLLTMQQVWKFMHLRYGTNKQTNKQTNNGLLSEVRKKTSRNSEK
jgi:hypothetical protein